MKIIGKSTYDDETVSDVLICENVDKFYANEIVNRLNEGGDNATLYFEVKEDDYKLYDASTIY